MRKALLSSAFTMFLFSTAAYADVPSVAVDIPPVHSLVAQVMKGVGTPDLIVQQGASPHGYSLRPAEAQALQNADACFLGWRSLGALAGTLGRLSSLLPTRSPLKLMETEGTTELEFREGATFEKHSHSHDQGDDDHDHDHEDHDHDDHVRPW